MAKLSRAVLWGQFLALTLLGFLLRAVLAGLSFWLVHALWLACVWSVQGFPPNLQDMRRWYALGAFNGAPIVSALLVGLLIAVIGLFLRRYGGMSVLRSALLGAGIGLLLIPPLAYVLLLWYAGVWDYRDWSVMMPTLARAYLFLGGTSAFVGGLIGLTTAPRRVRVSRVASAEKGSEGVYLPSPHDATRRDHRYDR